MWFASDNCGPAHPSVLEALARANEGHAASYGAEAAMARVTARLREIFEAPEAAVFLVATGTAANALALACLTPPWATILCHREAHVAVDECGAPEFYTGGAKLVPVDGEHGRIDPESLSQALGGAAPRGVHSVQRGAAVADQRDRGGDGLCAGRDRGAVRHRAPSRDAGASRRGAVRQCGGAVSDARRPS